MKALCATGDGALLREMVPPRGPAGWVQLRVLMAGVCRTDVAAATGRLPVQAGRILGHEICGVVASRVPGGPGVGTRVSVHPVLRDGRFVGLHVDGGFAERIWLPVEQLVVLPQGMDERCAAFVEPMAAALAVLRAPLPPQGRIALRGRGRIAELCRRVLAWGAVPLVEEDSGPLDALICTGTDPVDNLAGVRPGGLVVVKGRPVGLQPVDLKVVVERELHVVGVNYGSFEQAAKLLAEQAIPVIDLFGDVLPMSSFSQAFSASEDRKIFLRPEA